jgi:hypothetical protein
VERVAIHKVGLVIILERELLLAFHAPFIFTFFLLIFLIGLISLSRLFTFFHISDPFKFVFPFLLGGGQDVVLRLLDLLGEPVEVVLAPLDLEFELAVGGRKPCLIIHGLVRFGQDSLLFFLGAL